MAKSDFKPFATASGANVMSQEEWETLPALLSGFQSGKASSAQVNKALRQASFIAAALAQFVADKTDTDVADDGDQAAFVAKLVNGLGAQYLSRNNPFADIKADGPAAVSSALSNLGLKERGFEYSNVQTFGTRTTIKTSDFGGVIVVSANGQEIILPDIADVEIGKLITIYCFGGEGKTVTISSGKNATFSNGPSGSLSTKITLSTQESITIVSESKATSVWEIYGSGALKYSPLFMSSFNGVSGYQKLPGALVQTGTVGFDIGRNIANVTFPVAFASGAVVSLTWSDVTEGGSAPDTNISCGVVVHTQNRTGFQAWMSGPGGFNLSYIAVGY